MKKLKVVIGNWSKRLVGEAVSSKKTVVAATGIYFMAALYPILAFSLIVVWMVCQTLVDIAKMKYGQDQ
jgi:hypothetical protein